MRGQLWGAAAACCASAFLGRRLESLPAICQTGAPRYVGVAALLAVAVLVDVEVLVIVVVVVVAAGAATAARDRAGAGSPRDSASSRRRMLITPSRDAIWHCSRRSSPTQWWGEGGAVGRVHRPPYAP